MNLTNAISEIYENDEIVSAGQCETSINSFVEG